MVVSREAGRNLEDYSEEVEEILKEDWKYFSQGQIRRSTQYLQLQGTHIYLIVNLNMGLHKTSVSKSITDKDRW